MGQQKIIGRFEPIGKEVERPRAAFDVLTKEDWVEPKSGRPGFKGLAVAYKDAPDDYAVEYSVISEFWNWVPAGYAPAIPADGGPAFGELKQVGDRAIKQGGLTIRDYFAASALQGMLANPEFYKEAGRRHEDGESARKDLASTAFSFADAAMQERAK